MLQFQGIKTFLVSLDSLFNFTEGKRIKNKNSFISESKISYNIPRLIALTAHNAYRRGVSEVIITERKVAMAVARNATRNG